MILVRADSDITSADQLAGRILSIVEQPILTAAGIVDLTACVGLVELESGLAVEDVLARADLSLRAATDAGAGMAQRYRPALGEAAGDAKRPAASAVPPAAALAQSVEVHLRRYFDLHGDQLPPPGLYERVITEVERPLLELALHATGGNQLRTAELLGINRNTLRGKLTALNIGVTRRRKMV